MTVDEALSIIDRVVSNTLEEYNQSPDSKDDQGNRIPHPLDIVDPDDKLFALDFSLNDVALHATPVSLIETSGSTASELKRLSVDYYIRVPAAPQEGQNLDIDDGLSYAVVFSAIGSLWEGYTEYAQKSDMIIGTYNQAYRSYIKGLLSGTVASGAESYIRFSADGNDWHDSYTPGDIYISFKKIDTDTWTPAIKFVGEDGQDGAQGPAGPAGPVGPAGTPCSDTQFVALQDTPSSYTGMSGKIVAVKSSEDGVEFIDAPSGGGGGASNFTDLGDTPADYTNSGGKFLAVKSDASGVEFVDAPTGGLAGANVFGDKIQYSDDADGTFSLDAQNNNVFYISPAADTVLNFTQFDDGGTQVDAWWGTTYTFFLVSNGSVQITFDSGLSIFGDHSVEPGSSSSNTSITVTILKMFYTGYDWYVVSRTVITDANG